MATFHITPTSSVIQSPPGFNAFVGDTAGADSLTVTQSAFLMTVGPNTASAALLRNTGAWTITIHGVVLGQFGPALDFNSPVVGPAPVHLITIGAEGSVYSGSIGIDLVTSAFIGNSGELFGDTFAINQRSAGVVTSIVNSGIIQSNNTAINGASGKVVLKNSGVIEGDLTSAALTLTNFKAGGIAGNMLATGLTSLTNYGDIFGSVTIQNLTNDTILNYGNMSDASGGPSHAIDMSGGNDKLTNSGNLATIFGDVLMGSGNDALVNSGFINGHINMGGGINTVTNSGTITITSSFLFGGDTDVVTNTGIINSNLDLAGGRGFVVNSKVINGFVQTGTENDSITNSGTINSFVFTDSGDDRVTNNGNIAGSVRLGEGNDIYSGTGTAIQVIDEGGSDTYTFGTKGGRFLAVGTNSHDGVDQVNGGAGLNDIYDLTGHAFSSTINFDSVKHGVSDFPTLFFADVAANTALGTGIGTDIVKGIDWLIGSDQQEVVFGSAAANKLFGNGGEDILMGLGGRDFITGGTGGDLIVGGAGGDILYGNDGSTPDGVTDTFRYFKVSDSGVLKTTRDHIYDFEDGVDLISLASIDANSLIAGDQAFNFIGSNTGWLTSGPGSGAGQLRSYWTALGQTIEADINGDRIADFSIAIVDQDHSIVFTSADFIL